MPRLKNMQPQGRVYVLDAGKGKPRPDTVGREGDPRSGGVDYPTARVDARRAKGPKGEPLDVMTVTETEMKSSGIQTGIERGHLRLLPEKKATAKAKT